MKRHACTTALVGRALQDAVSGRGEPAVGVRDDQAHPVQARSRKEPSNCHQNASLSLSPTSQPRISLLPSEVTPTR